jgi:ketosteroid isomerase-like protein
MVHPNEQLARCAYVAQSQGDVDAYLDLLTDDFVLQIAGDYRAGMTFPGTSERSAAEWTDIPDFRARRPGEWGTRDRIDRGRGRARRPSATASSGPRVARPGRQALRLWLHPSDQHALEEYWGERT